MTIKQKIKTNKKEIHMQPLKLLKLQAVLLFFKKFFMITFLPDFESKAVPRILVHFYKACILHVF